MYSTLGWGHFSDSGLNCTFEHIADKNGVIELHTAQDNISKGPPRSSHQTQLHIPHHISVFLTLPKFIVLGSSPFASTGQMRSYIPERDGHGNFLQQPFGLCTASHSFACCGVKWKFFSFCTQLIYFLQGNDSCNQPQQVTLFSYYLIR